MRSSSLIVAISPLLLVACSPDDPETSSEIRGLYATPGDRLVVYIAVAGHGDELFTPENIAKMDAPVIVGVPWLRIDVPIDGGHVELATGDAGSFRHETSLAHPYSFEEVPVLMSFESGMAGLTGWVDAQLTNDGVVATWNLSFAGNYTLFPDIGPAWLEATFSEEPTLVTKQAP